MPSPVETRRPWLAPLAAAAFALALWGAQPAALQPARSSCDIDTPERVVAVGDVHGAYDRFVAILRAAKLIDSRERWTGGRAVFVQTGDVLDRGPDSRKALDLLRRLEGQASRAGGRVHALLGNHEVMRMLGDLRYVSNGEYAAFRTSGSDELRERYFAVALEDAAARARSAREKLDEAAFRKAFLDRTPLGFVEMQIAFGARGDYGRWLRERDAVVKINGIVFVHGGISPDVAGRSCESLNEAVRAEIRDLPAAIDAERAAAQLSTSEDGPLWYRGLAQEDETAFASEVDAILRALGARAIVTGHTVTQDGRVRTRFGGRVVQIDTGMLGGSFYPSGRAAALEIKDGQLTAIYEDKVEVVGRSR
jgi:hypothetical protein